MLHRFTLHAKKKNRDICKKTPSKYSKNIRTVTKLSKVKILVTIENPPTQKPIAKSLNTPLAI